MRATYFFFKLMPIKKNRILFLSRQGDSPSIDFSYMVNDIHSRYPEYEIKVLTKSLNYCKSVLLISSNYFIWLERVYALLMDIKWQFL